MKYKEEVIKWAADKDLLKPENAFKQYIKTVSEVGELGDALIKQDALGIIDGLGDVLVTLIILSEQLSLDLEDCLESAYNEIKNRSGVTKNGTFIKN